VDLQARRDCTGKVIGRSSDHSIRGEKREKKVTGVSTLGIGEVKEKGKQIGQKAPSLCRGWLRERNLHAESSWCKLRAVRKSRESMSKTCGAGYGHHQRSGSPVRGTTVRRDVYKGRRGNE